MKALFGALAAAALLGSPLVASAQAHGGYDGHGGDGRGAAPAGGNHGAMAPQRGYGGDRGGYANHGGYANRGGYAGAYVDGGYHGTGYANRGYDGRGHAGQGYDNRGYADRGYADRRADAGRGYDRRYNDRGYRGGYGYYGGYGGAIGFDLGAAPYAYSYSDDNGYYQPFDYGYSGQDDAYYAGAGGPPTGDYSDDNAGPPAGYYADDNAGPPAQYYGDDNAGPPSPQGYGYNSGYSGGAPPVDCGSWVWRGQAYQWAPAACGPCPPGYGR